MKRCSQVRSGTVFEQITSEVRYKGVVVLLNLTTESPTFLFYRKIIVGINTDCEGICYKIYARQKFQIMPEGIIKEFLPGVVLLPADSMCTDRFSFFAHFRSL